MALDQRKRQKNAEKRKAKQKARQRALISQTRDELTFKLQRAASAPILHCCVQDELWANGIGQLLLSRSLPNGDVAFTILLLDTYCLGVKDVVLGIMTWISYQEKITNGFLKEIAMLDLTPEGARKIVEGAVAYAGDLGLPPHADFKKAQFLFGDIDASTCTEVFEYGKDGKPFFVSGPYDSDYRCAQIVRMLANRLGTGGFHYMMSVPESQVLPNGKWSGAGLEFDEDFEPEFDDDEIDEDS